MDWIGLAQDRDRWRTLVSAVMNLWVPWNAGNFLTSCKPVSFSRTLYHGVSNLCYFEIDTYACNWNSSEYTHYLVLMDGTPWNLVYMLCNCTLPVVFFLSVTHCLSFHVLTALMGGVTGYNAAYFGRYVHRVCNCIPFGALLEEWQSNPHHALHSDTQIKGQVRLPVRTWISKAGYDGVNWLLLSSSSSCKMQMRNKFCLFLPHVGINHILIVWSVLFNTNSIDISALLGYLAVSMGSLLQTFQDSMSVKKYPMM